MQKDLSIAILGAGMSGICQAIKLKEAGFNNLTIYEKSEGVGGTWRDNTYPGCGCDVPSHLYSFSFEAKPDWSEKWSLQPEILKYFEDTAEKYGLLEHCKFNTEVKSAKFDEDSAKWQLELASGETEEYNILISGLGQLNQPLTPEFKGKDSFKGPQFHSARWDHSVDLKDKTVCVIGNGPSAVQFVPEIQPEVKKMINFQRSPAWVRDRGNFAYTPEQIERFENWDWYRKMYRGWIYWGAEIGWPFFREKSPLAGVLRKRCEDTLEAQIEDETLREKLLPNFKPGCKRILISDDYYPALAAGNVDVLRQGIKEIVPNGVIGEDGELYECDAIIYATGFLSTDFLTPMEITGLDGVSLNDAWKDGAEAHRGVAVSGFPNFFMLYGPNTNLGHNSIIFMTEVEANYITKCVKKLAAQGADYLMPTKQAMKRFNEKIQKKADKTVWAGSCNSWYKNEAGKITNNWPSWTVSFKRSMRSPKWSEYMFVS